MQKSYSILVFLVSSPAVTRARKVAGLNPAARTRFKCYLLHASRGVWRRTVNPGSKDQAWFDTKAWSK